MRRCIKAWMISKLGHIQPLVSIATDRFIIGTSSPMGNDRSPESQHNVGDTIIYDAQRQTVFNLGNFKWDHFHSISDENKTLSNISPFT